ncbi:MAG TPA: glycogen synthase [Methylomirabilota bacterium]|nr:glycogen synthase [Methylomirabilota bacterium]
MDKRLSRLEAGVDFPLTVKALVLSREYPPHVYGGAGVAVDQLTRALGRRLAVEVRCFGQPDPGPAGVLVRGYRAWDQLAPGPEGPRFAAALEVLSVGLAMARDATDADVVHAHTWYVSLAGYLMRALYRIPLIVTLHSLEPLRPWKADQLGSGYLVSTWAEKSAVEVAERVIAVSAAMREDILRHFTVAPERVAVVHNGIDPDRYRPTDRREALARHGVRPPYVLFVGRLSEQKGLFYLLEATRALAPDVQVVLCTTSPDTGEIAGRFERAVAGHPRAHWIRAMLPVDEVIQLYSHAAAFVCPSIYEPFGLINLEAMGCAAPVVASAVGGIPEVVVPGETGILVPPGQSDGLARALQWLLDHPAEARAMGRAGRSRAEKHFSWAYVAERTEHVYAEAIAAFRSSPAR